MERHQEHQHPEDVLGKVLERGGEKQQNGGDQQGRGELRLLAGAARGLHHGGLGRAAIDHKGSAQRRGQIGHGEADQIAVFIEPLLMAQGVGPCGGRALGHDHDGAGAGDGKQHGNLAPR